MISRRVVLRAAATMLAITSAIGLSGCNSEALGKKYPTIRYRLTVAVDTPQGVRSGSSVIEMQSAKAGKYSLTPHQLSLRARGEAVAVDLPGGQTLFALLRSDDSVDWAAWVPIYLVPEILPSSHTDYFADRLAEMQRRKGQVQILPHHFAELGSGYVPSGYPMMVRFRDINDPKTVELVDPDHLDKSFGPGVRLKFITVQVTDDAVTTGIEKRLPKPDAKGFFNWDGKTNPNEPGIFGIWNFVRGGSE